MLIHFAEAKKLIKPESSPAYIAWAKKVADLFKSHPNWNTFLDKLAELKKFNWHKLWATLTPMLLSPESKKFWITFQKVLLKTK